MSTSVEFSHVSSSSGRGSRKDCPENFLTEVLKVFPLGISLMGLLGGLSGQLSLDNFPKDSLKEFF